jgi:drug/metabolite transporter (DMT)-like permease
LLKSILLVLSCSFMIVLGQVLWKIAIDEKGGLIDKNLTLFHNVTALLSSPYMLSGILIYFVATVFWMYLLGKFEYSFIYPLFSMTYIISFIFASLVFHESITAYKIIGVVLIMAGVFFIARGGSN